MISDIRLQNFRSYTDDSFEFSPGVNIVVGPNASGKTNLIEAILVSCMGKSYRVKDKELIAFDGPWLRVDISYSGEKRTLKIIKQSENSTKELEIKGQIYKRLTMDKTIPVVLFEPNVMSLLTGSPDNRRDYLDNLLEQITPGYTVLRRQYKRTLAQRNRLLKQEGGVDKSQLFAWDIRLSQIGSEIAVYRHRLTLEINKLINDLYKNLSGSSSESSINYKSSCLLGQYSSDMLHKLEKSHTKDLLRGFTAYGPHRDDIEILLDGRLLDETASRGETRTVVLCLKIIELQLVELSRGQKPILLLDDVFSELDGSRRRALTEILAGYQTFITTTDADVVVDHFLDTCNVIPTNS